MLFHAVTLESPSVYTLGQRLFNNCSTSEPVGYGMTDSQFGAYNQAIFNKLEWNILFVKNNREILHNLADFILVISGAWYNG